VTSPTGSTNRPGGLRGQVWLDGYGWVQPIRDQRGQVLYYADPVTGARIARKVTGPATGPGSGNTKTATQAKQVNQKHAEATAPSPTTVAAGQQRIWLDGQLVTVQVSPDGLTWTTTPTNGGKAGTEAIPTAFSALDGAELEPTAPFLMGYKTRTGETQTPGPTSRLGGASTRNMLTVGGAAAWLASLSTKDQGAYAAMLEKLRNAGYLSQDDFLAAGGKWSAQAGRAMALAARDTAVVNTTAEGRDTTFTQFIDGKQNVYADSLKAKEEAGKQPYVPTERTYTDPEDDQGRGEVRGRSLPRAAPVRRRGGAAGDALPWPGGRRPTTLSTRATGPTTTGPSTARTGSACRSRSRVTDRSTPTWRAPGTSRRAPTTGPPSTAWRSSSCSPRPRASRDQPR
jgi:hypothetical protein